MDVIQINQITKDYGQNHGVFDLSFNVKQGEVLGFLGPNGAGKTTTIRQLLGFIKPDSGTVSILDKDCFNDASVIQEHLGYLPGEIAFIDSMSGIEFIHFIASMKHIKNLDRANKLIKRFDLNPNGKLRKMSKGMKQKIGIVCAFMQDSEILILDEPTSGLDPLMQNQFVDLILEEKKRGKTILMSSHIFEEVEKTCDRTVIIRDGRLVAIDTIENLCQNRHKQAELLFADTTMANSFAALFPDATIVNDKIILPIHNNINDIIREAGKYTLKDVSIATQSLEEFFMHFYGEGK